MLGEPGGGCVRGGKGPGTGAGGPGRGICCVIAGPPGGGLGVIGPSGGVGGRGEGGDGGLRGGEGMPGSPNMAVPLAGGGGGRFLDGFEPYPGVSGNSSSNVGGPGNGPG